MSTSTSIDRYFEAGIQAYIDGTLDSKERIEFEDYVSQHPDLFMELKERQIMEDFYQRLVPVMKVDEEIMQRMNDEAKLSMKTLLPQVYSSWSWKFKNWLNQFF